MSPQVEQATRTCWQCPSLDEGDELFEVELLHVFLVGWVVKNGWPGKVSAMLLA